MGCAASSEASSDALIPVAVPDHQLGTSVVLTGLVNKPELNDSVATIQSFDAARGRYTVKLQDGQKLALKPENLVSHMVAAQYPPGAKVLVQDLASRQDLNGVAGEILLFDASTSRYRVRLEGNKEVALKPQNLRPMVHPLPYMASITASPFHLLGSLYMKEDEVGLKFGRPNRGSFAAVGIDLGPRR